jgi:hypothetical protein
VNRYRSGVFCFWGRGVGLDISEQYINIEGWMVSRLGLQGDQLIAYAIVNGFSQGGAGEYTGGRQYMSEFLGWSTHKSGRLLNELLERGLITRREVSRHGAQVVYAYSVTGSCEEQNVTRHEVQIEPRRGTKRTSHEVQIEPRHEVQNVPHNYKDKTTSNNYKEREGGEAAQERSLRFSPPSLEQIRNYARESGRPDHSEPFFDYYTSNGWKVGRNAMKDWQAAYRQWCARERKKPQADTRKYVEQKPECKIEFPWKGITTT